MTPTSSSPLCLDTRSRVMGVKHDVADFFRRTFEESGVSEHVAMFINLANDPVWSV